MKDKIIPQERVKQKLDQAMQAKNKSMSVSRYKQLSAAACILLLVGFSIFYIQKTNTGNNKLAEQKYRDSIHKEEIAAVLQHLGRIESRSSSIIPGYNTGRFEKFDSTAINTEFEL